MAKYVCDFETVTSVGNSIKEAGNGLLAETNKYSSSIDTSLSVWSGTAKETAMKQVNEQSAKYVSSATNVVAYGQYLIDVSNEIEKTEDELSSWSL